MRLRLLKKRKNRVVFLCNFSTLLNRDTQTLINRHFFCKDFQQKRVPDDTLLKLVRSTCCSLCRRRYLNICLGSSSVLVFLFWQIRRRLCRLCRYHNLSYAGVAGCRDILRYFCTGVIPTGRPSFLLFFSQSLRVWCLVKGVCAWDFCECNM